MMIELNKADLKAIEMSLKLVLDDVSEELHSYETAGMDEASTISREVLSDLYNVLKKVRKINRL
jgi:small nuclear ribonucleoprotein (snRNP)-like protein